MKYFLHDTNAFNDEKIHELYLMYGYEGLGLFYSALEKLASQEKPVRTNVLKSQLNVGKKLNKCWEFMESLDILSSSNGETFNKQLLNFSEKYKIKKENNLKRISQWRENQSNEKNVTHSERVRNAGKVKESKVKESKHIQMSVYRKFKHLTLMQDEFDKLKDFGYNEIQINHILDNIENFKKNTRYTSLFLTAKNWLKKEYPKNETCTDKYGNVLDFKHTMSGQTN